MLIAIIILSAITICLIVAVLACIGNIVQLNNTTICGLQDLISMQEASYSYNQYFLSVSKVILEFVHMHSIANMNQCAKNDNFEEAKFLQQFCDAIEQLKRMEPKDIEGYEE